MPIGYERLTGNGQFRPESIGHISKQSVGLGTKRLSNVRLFIREKDQMYVSKGKGDIGRKKKGTEFYMTKLAKDAIMLLVRMYIHSN